VPLAASEGEKRRGGYLPNIVLYTSGSREKEKGRDESSVDSSLPTRTACPAKQKGGRGGG